MVQIDPRFLALLEQQSSEREQALGEAGGSGSPPRPPLNDGGGGGNFSPMDNRVTRLEVEVEHLGRTLSSIDGKLDKVNDRLMLMPTRSDLWQWKWQWSALALAVVAIVIGGIIGGLSWIQPEPSPASAPTIIQLPAQVARP